jgi:HlyD family secretion protein
MARSRWNRWWYVGAAVIVAGLAILPIGLMRGPAGSSSQHAHAEPPPAAKEVETGLRVETMLPISGGLTRRTSQPGSAHSWESAELYSKVSGFLLVQHVDIGSRVKRGDVLAEIDVPELKEDVESAAAQCEQSRAEVAQAEARVESAIADHKAAQSRVAQSRADTDRFDAEVQFHQKQFDRLTELKSLKGIEPRVVDERQLQLQAAQANHRAAQSTVLATEQQAVAAESRITLAKADLAVTRAKLKVAESQFDRANVMASYTKIVSPYDGVVTCRNFHRGAYIRSPDQGGQVPLLAVDRTDQMRVLVRIPEREVPFIQAGDKAIVRFDALPRREFTGKVARIAESEESATRTMLAEVDLPNPDRLIRDQMYGRVEIHLEEASQGLAMIASSCLIGDVTDGQAELFVVRDGQARLRKIVVGRDTGVDVEVLSGLAADEAVVVRPPGGLSDGAAVTAISKVASK